MFNDEGRPRCVFGTVEASAGIGWTKTTNTINKHAFIALGDAKVTTAAARAAAH